MQKFFLNKISLIAVILSSLLIFQTSAFCLGCSVISKSKSINSNVSLTSSSSSTEASKKISEESKPVFGKVISNGLRSLPKIALTFDADMTPYMASQLKSGKVKSYYNSKIIDILTSNNIKATIFITGLWAEEYRDVTKNLAENPLFEIGNHSYKHFTFESPCYGLPALKDTEKEKDFTLSQSILKDITGFEPKLLGFQVGVMAKAMSLLQINLD